MADQKQKLHGLVYSTEHGRMCPDCSKPTAQCVCHVPKKPVNSDGFARVRLDTKGRKGKGVTVISGLSLDPPALAAFLKEMKHRCGSGGTVKEGQIEIQGDHRTLVADELNKRGWKFKLVGG